MPVWLSRGRLNRPRPGRDFRLNRRTVELPALPDEMGGLTITHLSDPHVGELVTPAHLRHAVEAANRLRSDLVVVTGDFIDLSTDWLPPVVDALSELQAPLGVYHVLGNHDHLENVGKVSDAFREAGLNLLVNEARRASHHARSIGIGGIDWASSDVRLERLVRRTAREMPEADLRILLAHHPHAFEAACRCGIHLTFAGHTHGGQVLLSRRRARKALALGSLNHRYRQGLYRRGAHHLHVSSGIGSWFPLRFRCPAEITQLDLRTPF